MSETAVIETKLSKFPLIYRGKVRDIYEDGGKMLIVTTDRISAFDYVLPSPLPGKGKILTQLSVFWFNQTKNLIPNHLLTTDASSYAANEEERKMLEGRSMVVKKVKRLDVEAIVRGHLTGSAWADYQKKGEINGIKLPPGMRDGDAFPEPLFTPSTKAEVGTHDEPMTFQEVVNLLGEKWANKMKEVSLKIFKAASEKAKAHGLLLADTKMEFEVGRDELILIDEFAHPDSSRFGRRASINRESLSNLRISRLVRDYLLASPWDRKSTPPPLPDEIVKETLHRYRTIAEMLMKN
ncbi:MAG: phosphoribosylaminoimidazolesuccinocarboxamide synthase [bacterium]